MNFMNRQSMTFLGILLVGVTLTLAPAQAASYHISCTSGDDANSGTSAAWRTLARANTQSYAPGDQILLERGCTWTEGAFRPTSSGTPEQPIVMADYASGSLPRIVGDQDSAVILQNVQNWTVRNLELTQQGQTPQPVDDAGKDADSHSDLYMKPVLDIRGLGPEGVIDCGEPCTVRNILLEDLVVHDGTWNGIYVGAGIYQITDNTFGYVDNVTIRNVEAFNNHKAGIEFTSTYTKEITYHTTNVQVLDSYLHHNGGDGVMMGPVRFGLIDGCDCSYNGQLRDARLGCWTWDSRDVVIQFTESHHNVTPANDSGARDGGGFDLDLGTIDCLLQYNWSHDNEGEGFLLMTWPIGFGFSNRGVSFNQVMRYNISERDARKLSGSIEIFGGADAWIYNNTIYYVSARDSSSEMFEGEGGAIATSTWGKSGNPVLRIYNNVFIADGTVNPGSVNYLFRSAGGKGTFTFDNNLWWRVEGGVLFKLGGTVINNWAGWQSRGFDLNGVNADPLVAGPLGGGPSAYQLTAASPAIDAGRVVSDSPYGPGTQDYAGTPTPQGSAFDIGAFEFAGGGDPPPPPPPDEGTVMHAADIFTSDSAGNPKDTFTKGETIYWQGLIHDSGGSPVSGADVKTEVMRPDGSVWVTQTSTTDANGRAFFSRKSKNPDPAGTYTINVTDVVKTDATYDPAANVKDSHQFTLQ